MKIKIVDAPMGVGKTSSAINYINSTDGGTRILYITPYLTEVERIVKNCPEKHFKQPESYGSKLNGIKYLFEKGINIVSTHALFSSFTDEIIDLAYNNSYILIMDEVANVIEPLLISKYDLETLLEKYTRIENGHLLKWYATDYDGRFEDYKRLCDLGCVGIYNNNVILWLFPISTFRAFRDIYVLTYLFEAQTQKYYFDYYNVEYENLYIAGDDISNYHFTNDIISYNKYDYSKLIHICDDKKINEIGSLDYSLSKTWYKRNKDNILLKKLKNNCVNYFVHKLKSPSEYNLWTTFKDYKKQISGKGYAKGFLSSNMRATNEYRYKTAVAYLVNKFFNPYIKNFFLSNGIEIDEDMFALSEMLQWIWRSAIRDGKEINIYIPSQRMRTLLKDWIYNKQA